MFGDKNIEGKSNIIVDNQNKIRIPNYTLVEQGDELAVFYFEREGKYLIYNLNYIKFLIKHLEYEISKTDNKLKRNELRNKKTTLLRSLSRALKVDKNKNIKLFNKENNSEFKCKGMGKSLVLERLN